MTSDFTTRKIKSRLQAAIKEAYILSFRDQNKYIALEIMPGRFDYFLANNYSANDHVSVIFDGEFEFRKLHYDKSVHDYARLLNELYKFCKSDKCKNDLSQALDFAKEYYIEMHDFDFNQRVFEYALDSHKELFDDFIPDLCETLASEGIEHCEEYLSDIIHVYCS